MSARYRFQTYLHIPLTCSPTPSQPFLSPLHDRSKTHVLPYSCLLAFFFFFSFLILANHTDVLNYNNDQFSHITHSLLSIQKVTSCFHNSLIVQKLNICLLDITLYIFQIRLSFSICYRTCRSLTHVKSFPLSKFRIMEI